MSGLLPKAAVEPTSMDGREVPEAAVSNHSKPAYLFDHLVGEREQLVGYVDAKRLRGFEVDE